MGYRFLFVSDSQVFRYIKAGPTVYGAPVLAAFGGIPNFFR